MTAYEIHGVVTGNSISLREIGLSGVKGDPGESLLQAVPEDADISDGNLHLAGSYQVNGYISGYTAQQQVRYHLVHPVFTSRFLVEVFGYVQRSATNSTLLKGYYVGTGGAGQFASSESDFSESFGTDAPVNHGAYVAGDGSRVLWFESNCRSPAFRITAMKLLGGSLVNDWQVQVTATGVEL